MRRYEDLLGLTELKTAQRLVLEVGWHKMDSPYAIKADYS